MTGKKVFTEPRGRIMNVIYDIIELQNARLLISDAVHGKILYRVMQYDYEWELFYTITESSTSKCTLTLELIGDRPDKEKEILRQLALLVSLLGGGPDGVEIAEVKKPERNGNGHARAAYVPESEGSGA